MANDNDKKDDDWDDEPTKSNNLSPQEAMRLGRARLQERMQGAEDNPIPKAAEALPAGQITAADKRMIEQLLAEFNIQISFNDAQQINIAKEFANNLRVNAILRQHGLIDKKVPNPLKVQEWINDQAKQNAFKDALAEVLSEVKLEAAVTSVTVDEVKEVDVTPAITKASAKPVAAAEAPIPLSDSERNRIIDRRGAPAGEEETKVDLPPVPVPFVANPASRAAPKPIVPSTGMPPLPATPSAAVSPQPLAPDPQFAKRQRVVAASEFGVTESSYLASLQLMLVNRERLFQHASFKQLKKPQKKLLQEMMSLCEQVVKSNQSLNEAFQQLHQQIAQVPEDPESIKKTLGTIAQLIGPATQLHSQYFAMYEGQFLPMQRDPAVKEALNTATNFNLSQVMDQRLTLLSHLIMPVQRGTRYADLCSAFEKQLDPSAPYYDAAKSVRPIIEETMKEANAKLRLAHTKALRNSIYEGKISLPLLQEYARAKIDEERSSESSMKEILKRIKKLEDANPTLPTVLHQFSEVNLGWRTDLFKPADEIDVKFPSFASQEKSLLEKPSSDTYSDIEVSAAMGGSAERKAIKSRLRYGEADILSVLPAGCKIVAAKKQLGVRADFVVQDRDNNNVLQIIVDRDHFSIRELKGDYLSDDDKLALMHHLMHAVKNDAAEPVVTSENPDKIRRLNEIAVNAHGDTYAQTTKDKIKLHKRIENDTSSHTSRMLYPTIDITVGRKKVDDVKERFVKVITQGSFVPKLVNPNSNDLTLLSGDVTISTDIPLLATKQYEAALAVGMTPTFTKDAKRMVDGFIKKQLSNNRNDTQISIDVPPGSAQISGEDVLRRLTLASNEGFVSTLNPQAQNELKAHISTLQPDDRSLEYALSLSHSHPAELLNSLIVRGLLPQKEVFGDGRELRQLMRENALANPGQLVIDSGSQARDYHVLKTATEDLGMKVGISVVNTKKMRAETAKGELHVIDLKNISTKQQVDYAKQMAEYGIFANFTAPVQQGENILIRSKNPAHLRVMFEKYLNQGFLPTCNSRIKELSASGAFIRIEGNDPKIIWERMKHCSMSGLKIQLSPEQIALMKKFSEKHNPALPIHGHSWGAAKYNIELANQLGMSILGVSETAQAAYVKELAIEKQNGRAMPQVEINPIQVTEKRFLRRDRQVNDKDRTKQFAEMLLKYGVNVSVNNLADMKAEAEKESKKTKWFGLSSTPTDNAVKAKAFLKNLESIQADIQTNTSAFNQATVASLQAKANALAPDMKVTKVAEPSVVAPTAPIAAAASRQQFLPSDGARVMPALPATPSAVATELTLDEVITKFKAIRDKAHSDFDFKIDYRNPTRVYDNAQKICNVLEQMKSDSPAQQMVNLRELLLDLSKGSHSLLKGEKAAGYTLDESMKAEARGLLERIPQVSKASLKPSGGGL